MYFVCFIDIYVDVKFVCDEVYLCICKWFYDLEVKGCGEECLNRYVIWIKYFF